MRAHPGAEWPICLGIRAAGLIVAFTFTGGNATHRSPIVEPATTA
jgi:hypothetical protein